MHLVAIDFGRARTLALIFAFVLGAVGGAAVAGLLPSSLLPPPWRLPVGGFLAGLGMGIALLSFYA